MVRDPTAGFGVQVQDLTFFTAVAAALPRIQGPAKSGLCGVPLGLFETSMPVQQQRLRQGREAQGQHGKNIQFIPEYVPPIRFAVPSPRGDAGIQLDRMQRDRLQQVEEVQPERELGAFAALEAQVALLPDLIPVLRMRPEQVLEPAGVHEGIAGPLSAFRNAVIPGGIQRHDFFNGQGLAFRHRNRTFLSDVVPVLHQGPGQVCPGRIGKKPGARGLGDADFRLSRLRTQKDPVPAERGGFQGG